MRIFVILFAAALAGMGVGSGGLFIVYLTLLAGVEQYTAQALNLWFFLFAAGAAMTVHLRVHRLPRKRLVWLCIFGGLGCIGGSLAAVGIDRALLRTVFALVLIVSGTAALVRGVRAQKSGNNGRKHPPFLR